MSRIVIAKSVRASCTTDQNPFPTKIGILVVIIAVIIIINRGIAAILTDNPIKIRVPHTISKQATKDARNSGFANPIFSNLPAPSISGKRNFWIPSERKTSPTINLGSNDL